MKHVMITLAGIALASAVAGTAAAKDIKISHQWKTGDGRDEAARVFVAAVEERDPSLDFRIYPSRSLISAPIKQLEALQDGSVEMAIYPLHYGAGQVPAFSVTMLPGLIRSIDHGLALRDSEFGEALQQTAMENGVRIVAWWWTPAGFVTRSRVIRGPETVSGLRLRGADAYVDMILERNGASVQSMAGTEVFSAMQTGVLDGLVTSSESMISYGLPEVADFATVGGDYNFVTLVQPLVMSRQHWEALSDEQKEIFDEAARISEQHFAELQRTAGAEAIAAFEEAGVEVHHFTADEYEAWVSAAERVSWPAFEERAENGSRLIELAREVE